MATATVCVCGSAPLEKHAVEEFAKYATMMTGVEPERAGEAAPDGGKIVVSVGKSAAAQSLIEQGLVSVPDDLGEDGFILKSVETEGQRCLVLLGGSPRGTLYAVYHYLETLCKVGFFWDGEQVPRLDQIPVDGIDIVERPRFPVREYMMDCEYTSYWWGWEEWKREVDWAAKHRINLMSSNFDFTATWRRVWKKFGVDVPATGLTAPPFHPWAGWHKWDIKPPYPEDFQEAIADLCKKFVDYGRSLGIKMAPDYRGFLGQVPKEFYEAYRDKARFIDIPWWKFGPGKFIYPTEPLYKEVWKAYLEEYIKRFGTDHIYAAQTFSEMEAGKTPEEQKETDIANAISALEIVRSVDPEGTLFTQSWTWLNKKMWPKANIKAYLDAYPDEAMVIWELTGPGGQQHKDLDYYFGKRWLLGFLVCLAGQVSLHGDLPDIIKRVQAVAAEPKADRCLGIAVQPEALHHNHMHFDLLYRLGWNPMSIEVESFLADYSVRRYGKESAPKMIRCLRELVASVYGSYDQTCPLYHLRIYEAAGLIYGRLGEGSHTRQVLPERSQFLPHLEKALAIALEEREKLGRSVMYQHDLIDIARQFLGDLFNLHMVSLYHAFRAGEKDAFEKEARILEEILESQEMLLSSSDMFCLQPIIEKAMELPNVPEDYDQRIRDILTVWADKIIDYAHRDYYELVRFYYSRRVDAFIKNLRERLAAGSTEIDDEELTPLYHEIEQAWVKKPFKVEKSDKYAGTPAEAAAEVLKKHRLGEAELKQIEALAGGDNRLRDRSELFAQEARTLEESDADKHAGC